MSGANVRVRSYEARDHDALVQLWKKVFPNAPARNDPARDIARKLDEQPELLLVGELDGAIVAATLAGWDGHRAWLHLVSVHPDHQRKGIGAAIVLHAVERLGELGYPKVNLQIRGETPGVAAFYEKLGFVVEERISMGRVLS